MGEVRVTERLGEGHIHIATASGIVIARHRLAAAGTGAQIRDHGHVVALDQAALAASALGGTPHRRKERIPPGGKHWKPQNCCTTTSHSQQVRAADTASVIDLGIYERAAQNRTQLR